MFNIKIQSSLLASPFIIHCPSQVHLHAILSSHLGCGLPLFCGLDVSLPLLYLVVIVHLSSGLPISSCFSLILP